MASRLENSRFGRSYAKVAKGDVKSTQILLSPLRTTVAVRQKGGGVGNASTQIAMEFLAHKAQESHETRRPPSDGDIRTAGCSLAGPIPNAEHVGKIRDAVAAAHESQPSLPTRAKFSARTPLPTPAASWTAIGPSTHTMWSGRNIFRTYGLTLPTCRRLRLPNKTFAAPDPAESGERGNAPCIGVGLMRKLSERFLVVPYAGGITPRRPAAAASLRAARGSKRRRLTAKR